MIKKKLEEKEKKDINIFKKNFFIIFKPFNLNKYF